MTNRSAKKKGGGGGAGGITILESILQARSNYVTLETHSSNVVFKDII